MDANASRDSNQRLQRLESVTSECEAEIDSMANDALELTKSLPRSGSARSPHRPASGTRNVPSNREVGSPLGLLSPLTERIFGPLGTASQADRFIILATHPELRAEEDRLAASGER